VGKARISKEQQTNSISNANIIERQLCHSYCIDLERFGKPTRIHPYRGIEAALQIKFRQKPD
jgi:hypothetical protein